MLSYPVLTGLILNRAWRGRIIKSFTGDLLLGSYTDAAVVLDRKIDQALSGCWKAAGQACMLIIAMVLRPGPECGLMLFKKVRHSRFYPVPADLRPRLSVSLAEIHVPGRQVSTMRGLARRATGPGPLGWRV